MKDDKKYILGKIIIPDNYYINMDFSEACKYDKHIVWRNTNHTSPVELFIDKKYSELQLNKPDMNTELKKLGLNNLICNLIKGIEDERLIAMWRMRGAYTMPKIYGMPHYTYTNIVEGFDKLKKAEYANMKIGYYDRAENKGKLTRIWATEKLVEELNELSLISYSLNEELSTYFNEEAVNISSLNFTKVFYDNPIILKDAKKIKIMYGTNKKTSELKKFLLLYNDFISNFNITIPADVYYKNNNFSNHTFNYNLHTDYTSSTSTPLLGCCGDKYLFNKKLDCRLYRVFNNGKFDQGGRFYGAEYQRLSELKRRSITINGEAEIEIDYSGLHGRMIYHYYEKVVYNEDPYLIKDFKCLRDAFKKMFQMCINANNKIAALSAFKKSLVEDDNGWEIKKLMHQNNVSIEWLYEKLAEKHKRIINHFNSGVGIKLQYIDSMIAESILKHFTRKGVPCLCIHDSFIVPISYKDELEEVMKREYYRIIGFDCKLKVNG